MEVIAPSLPTIRIGKFTVKDFDEQKIIIFNDETGDGGVFNKAELADYLEAFYSENF